MKKLVCMLAAMGLTAGLAYAGGESCKASAAAAKAGGSCTAASPAMAGDAKTGGCCATKGAKTAGMSCCATDMPTLTYKIGDKTTGCPADAKTIAAANPNAKMTYVVGGKDFNDMNEANKALSTALTGYYDSMLSVKDVAACSAKTCPVTGKELAPAKPAMFQVASYEFSNKDAAAKAAAAAREAGDKVMMTTLVDGKSYTCPTEAAAACKTGKNVEYVIGETKTQCNVMASVELAKARIAAAQQSLANASKPQNASSAMPTEGRG